MRVLALVVVLAFGVACASQDELDESSSSLACDHFRNIMADVDAGILTDEELRDKLKEVDDNTVGVGTDDVRTAARSMLVAITADDPQHLLDAVGQMDAACTEAGH